ncbi:MAG TPA: fatty acid desaturase [Roseiarcus sp.]|jgi:stearoyl-CoA desaturase (delta-9 desaturase)|nr:fatty acid desaturase [Roseiarcus sp.]
MSQDTPSSLEPSVDRDSATDIVYPSTIPFIIVHLVCFAAIWTGVTVEAVAIGIGLYWLRIFAIGAGYHRYFSHRAYETSRAFQFILAALAQSTSQKSVLWWAANHRDHHLHSDTELDVHSPRHTGFIYSHVGWIFSRGQETMNVNRIADFAKYPELMWLHRYEQLPAFVLAVLCLAVAGWPGLIVGFFWSTVAVYHGTFSINSLAHLVGKRRYVTGDDSRNNWLLAIITMGEGWHNNHHAYQSSARQGFYWWEYDPTFYLLTLLERLRLVWNLKRPTAEVMQNQHRLGSRVISRAASQVAESFYPERIAAAVAAALGNSGLADLRARLSQAQPFVARDVFSEFNLPHIPNKAEIVGRARSLLANSPSMEDIAAKAHELLLEAVGARLATIASQTAY